MANGDDTVGGVNVCDPREKRRVFQSQSRDCALVDLLVEATIVFSESTTNRIECERYSFQTTLTLTFQHAYPTRKQN